MSTHETQETATLPTEPLRRAALIAVAHVGIQDIFARWIAKGELSEADWEIVMQLAARQMAQERVENEGEAATTAATKTRKAQRLWWPPCVIGAGIIAAATVWGLTTDAAASEWLIPMLLGLRPLRAD